MMLKKYPKYRPSNIDWVGDIPTHWDLLTVGKIGFLGRGRVISNIEIQENVGSFPVYSSQTENNGVMGLIDTYDFEGEYVTWTTDGANAGRVFYRSGKFNCTNVCGTLKPKNENIHLPYFPYLLNLGTRYYVRYDINPKLMNGVMSRIPIPLPPLPEQQAIANFLDEKTKKIDTLIAQKEKLIELLKEKRAALINQAVTKGLNPKAKMKDSGIEWLGEIPAHWEVKKLKYLVDLIDEKDDGSANSELYISLDRIESWTGKLIDSAERKPESFGNIFKKGDVLFNKLRPYLAKILITEENGVCVSDLLVLRNKKDLILNRFLFYRTISSPFIAEVNSASYGTKMPRASWDYIGSLPIFYPSIQEQNEIVNYIEKTLAQIEILFRQSQKEIDILQEYRTTPNFRSCYR